MSQAASSKLSGDESKLPSTVSNTDEKDPFLTPSEEKKPNQKIKSNYFFTVGYHLALWVFLVALGSPFFFYFHTPWFETPCYYGYGSLIGHYPKLNMVPNAADDKDTKDYKIHIHFDKNDEKTFNKYVDDISAAVNKTNDPRFNFSDPAKVGVCTESNKYGFGSDQPCFFLQFNKILGYIPDLKKPEECTSDDCCYQPEHRLKITCDYKEGKYQIFPKDGLSICQWPYVNRTSTYNNPSAFLQITEMPNAADFADKQVGKNNRRSVEILCWAVNDELGLVNGESKDHNSHILRFFIDEYKK